MTRDRFAKGMTFDEYVAFVATSENLAREGSQGPRRDFSGVLRTAYDAARLSEAHERAWRWMVEQPNGPANVMAIAEEWSSDCRRDIPMLARLADTVGLELRIFPRDGRRCARGPAPESDAANADLVARFANVKNGRTWLSIPVIVFYSKGLEELYRYVEYPSVYDKDRLVGAIRAARAGESEAQTRERGDREFVEMLGSPMFEVWRAAALDEWTSRLYERLRTGAAAAR